MFDLFKRFRPTDDREQLAEAKRATLTASEEVKALTRELRAIEKENHIAAKVHAAFRGE